MINVLFILYVYLIEINLFCFDLGDNFIWIFEECMVVVFGVSGVKIGLLFRVWDSGSYIIDRFFYFYCLLVSVYLVWDW